MQFKCAFNDSCLLAAFLLLASAAIAQQRPDVPYVPTPWNVVEAMLDADSIAAGDYVIDLGSGDGRVVIEAAKQRGAHGMGIELDPNLVSIANREAVRLGVGAKAKFVSGNLFAFDFSKATVLTMYLLPHINLDLRPRIFQLRPGTRVVSHDFDMGKWRPDLQREVSVPDKSYGAPSSQVYLWYVPANVAGKWQWRMPAGETSGTYQAAIGQTFQQLSAEVTVDGGRVNLEAAKLQGDAIAFTLVHEAAGRKEAYAYSGHVDGDKIVGRIKRSADDKVFDWQATRLWRGQINIE